MFKLKKENLMYTMTTFQDIVDELMRTNLKPDRRIERYRSFDVDLQEDGKQKVTIPVTGHNPKNIKVTTTDELISVKSKVDSETSRFVKDIDLELSVGKDYDGNKTEAKFENGLLTLLIDKKVDKKAKEIKISY